MEPWNDIKFVVKIWTVFTEKLVFDFFSEKTKQKTNKKQKTKNKKKLILLKSNWEKLPSAIL